MAKKAMPDWPGPNFKPFNRLSTNSPLAVVRQIILAEGFEIRSEPADCDGVLQAVKYIDAEGADGTYHFVVVRFERGYSVDIGEGAQRGA